MCIQSRLFHLLSSYFEIEISAYCLLSKKKTLILNDFKRVSYIISNHKHRSTEF